MPTAIALIDPHLLFREAFRALISRRNDLQLSADLGSSEDAFPLFDTLVPDIAVTEISLPGSSGIALAREIRRKRIGTKTVILTTHAIPEFVVAALDAGACGYLLKSQGIEEVAEALQVALSGRVALAPSIPRSVLEELDRRRTLPDLATGPLADLSGREHEVFELAVRNFSNREIARQLCISVKTVETHRANINRKLKVHSCAELVHFAARHGLLVS